MTEKKNPLEEDLDYILTCTAESWEDLRGRRIFITGGTGFFGCWLLESFLWANSRLSLDASALVLTRNPEAFRKSMPHLAADSALSFHPGDIRSFDFPSGEFSHVIHCATTNARATFHNEDPLVKFDTIVAGTKHALDFAVKCRALKFIMTSSGSVYGKQPPDMNLVPEDYCGAPELSDMSSALGEGKRAAEFLCAYYSDRYGIETKIARCFSFVGPYMPLDIHYAIGNFIRDGLEGGPIRVTGDGRAYRSYLYAADLVIWLLRILVRGESKRAYNVGSEDSVSIGELAGIVAGYFGNKTGVSIAGAPDYSRPAGRYVPSTSRAQKELGLQQNISLTDAVKKTIAYYQPIF